MNSRDLAVLRCPACTGKLTAAELALECRNCSKTYPVEDGIIDLRDDSTGTSSWKLQQFFEWIPPLYQSVYFPFLYRLGTIPESIGPERAAGELVERTATTGGTVLDVACGPGRLTRKLAGQNETVYGLDLSRGMLRRALSETKEPLTDRIRYVRGDALNLPFAPGGLDALTCSGALYFFSDLVATLEGFGTVLREGGRLAGMTVVKDGILGSSTSQFLLELYQYVETFRTYRVEAFVEALDAAGFSNPNFSTQGCVMFFDATFEGR